MEFMYHSARLPKDQQSLMSINAAANRLYNKLKTLEIQQLDISDYIKRSLGKRLTHLTSSLILYSYILSWSLAKSDLPISESVFLDYGGGSGMLCLLAKELGLGTVIYTDIYDVSCHDARLVAESIGNQADHYVQGDMDNVFGFLRTYNINCNAVASYDVIEHIYDIESFFVKLPLFSDGPLTIVMSSGANPFNPMINRRRMRSQLEVEYKDRKKQRGHKERDCLKSYLNARAEIIHEYSQQLNQELTEGEIEQLARKTRGMMEVDIRKCVDRYVQTGELPPGSTHPTNTCDPYTGNWAEHLIDPYSLARILSGAGFKVDVLSGYYGRPKDIAERLLNRFSNLAIYLFQKQGIRIAPFYTVYGRRDSN